MKKAKGSLYAQDFENMARMCETSIRCFSLTTREDLFSCWMQLTAQDGCPRCTLSNCGRSTPEHWKAFYSSLTDPQREAFSKMYSQMLPELRRRQSFIKRKMRSNFESQVGSYTKTLNH